MSVRLLGVGTAVPERSYTQAEVYARFGYTNRVAKRVFGAPHIARRHLLLPPEDSGPLTGETNEVLLERFRSGSETLGVAAITRAAAQAGVAVGDLGAIVCATSTGLLVPGLTCLLAKAAGLPASVFRLDVVGMGCNAGLNALAALHGWAARSPGRPGVLVCCEVNSAAYCPDDTARDAIVNSLFGDGVAAAVVGNGVAGGAVVGEEGPEILDFESHMLGEESGSMRFDWHPERQRQRFFLSRDIPYILGVHAGVPVGRLLERHGLRRRDIDHWVIHTGGGAVIDAIKQKLGLSEQDVRHTRGVLRDYGNLSSGSFLFSFERLVPEVRKGSGEYGMMMTMGPGAQIECALLRW